MNLVYFTVGFNPEYINLLYLAIKSLRKRNSVDIMVICDESLVDNCSAALKEFSNIIIAPCENSNDAPDSSMKKLQIFKYDLSKYSKILFIDSDVLIGTSLDCFFDGITQDKLYAGEEINNISKHINLHKLKYHSFLNYTEDDISFLEKNKIKPFNCGFFGFMNNFVMKEHFDNILEMIKTHTGDFYYEQSFMNVYFNLRNLTDTSLINSNNYTLGFITEDLPLLDFLIYRKRRKNKVVHFAYCRGFLNKLKCMNKYWKLFVE
jgi:lipopolysaccharide biosynthesis glycosyltransferase